MKDNKIVKNIALVLLGNSIYAFAVVAFIIPHELVVGGSTGIGLFLNHHWNISISSFATVFNMVMFITGLLLLGKKFAITTMLSTFYYPIILGQLENVTWIQTLVDNRLLAVIMAGIMIGIGIGIVIKVGASTGGMDIPPLILNKKLGIPVAVGMYGFDITILLLQMTYSKWDKIIMGILLICIYTFVLDKVITAGTKTSEPEPCLKTV